MKSISIIAKAVIIVGLISFSLIANGQVGINATSSDPHASAGLDVDFNNLGVLIPRVALTQTSSSSPITSPATSLLVYNTATQNDVTPGYYYWDGTRWLRFATIANGVSDAWTITGNTGTTAGTNFLGTTDNQALDIRTNDTIRMRITSYGNVGIGTTSPVAKLDVQGGSIRWGYSYLSLDQDGSIELGNSLSSGKIPFIDFHYGTGASQDFNVRIINNGNKRLSLIADTTYMSGNVGIGTTNPAQKLDVAGNIKFSGALMPDNNAGTSGQILQSNGPGVAPTWVDPTNVLVYGNHVDNITLNSLATTTNTSSWEDIPGMSTTFTPSHDRIFIFASLVARLADNSGNAQFGQAIVSSRILVDGVEVAKAASVITDYDQDPYGGEYTVTSGMISFSGVPVNVTAGVPVVIKMQWRAAVGWAYSPWKIEISPGTADDHCTMTVFD